MGPNNNSTQKETDTLHGPNTRQTGQGMADHDG